MRLALEQFTAALCLSRALSQPELRSLRVAWVDRARACAVDGRVILIDVGSLQGHARGFCIVACRIASEFLFRCGRLGRPSCRAAGLRVWVSAIPRMQTADPLPWLRQAAQQLRLASEQCAATCPFAARTLGLCM